MIVVVDASVALKWFFQGRSSENHVEAALDILAAVSSQQLTMTQPSHFLAEVAAVLAREKPDAAQDDLADLQDIDWNVREDRQHYERAINLSVRTKGHLFDTLYHAVALSIADAVLITADRGYYERAREFGQIVLVADFELP